MSLSLGIEVVDRGPTYTRIRVWTGHHPLFHGRDVTRAMSGELTWSNVVFDEYVALLDRGLAESEATVDVYHYLNHGHDVWTVRYAVDFWSVDCRAHDVELADRDFDRACAMLVDHLEEHHT